MSYLFYSVYALKYQLVNFTPIMGEHQMYHSENNTMVFIILFFQYLFIIKMRFARRVQPMHFME